MTISIKVSINGNYKVPVSTQYEGGDPITEIISGRGLSQPFVKDIPFYHGVGKIVTVVVGPEESDNG